MSGDRRPPRIPTWALVAAVAGVLTASAVLFVASRTQHHRAKPAPATHGDAVDGSDDTLILPKQGDEQTTTTDSTDATHDRTELGRGSADAHSGDAATATTPTTATSSTQTPSDDSPLAPVSGKRIALAPADAGPRAGSKATGTTRIGTTRVACTAKPNTAALTRERQLLDALTSALTRAGAKVTRLDDADGNVPCASQRSATFEASDLSLVIAADAAASSASVPVAGGSLATADVARAKVFVQALDHETGATAQTKPTGAAATAVISHGVVDVPRGGTVAYLALNEDADQLDATELANSIAAAFATALA